MPKRSARGDSGDVPARQSRAAILPSQSIHHCTPPVIAEGIIYPVLGDPVDLDPCSNKNSIIRARRVVMPPENGKDLEWRGKVFCNPPYGHPEIDDWIEKCVKSYRFNGAEIIGLFPANVSAEWFDMVVATARAVFLWGPGEGGRRVKFGGNKHKATFASALAYWGPNLPLFVRHAIRFCHPWFPEYDLRLVRAMLADANGSGEAISALAVADDLLAQNRHDDLASALVALGDLTLGDIMDFGRSALLHRLRDLSAYELASALICATRPGTHWLERRLPRTPDTPDPRQSTLPLALPEGAAASVAHDPDESLEDFVFRLIAHSGDGLGVQTLIDRTGQTRGRVRGVLDRLRSADRVIKRGNTNKAVYATAGAEEGQHAAR